MIPGTDVSMENLLKFQYAREGKVMFQEVIKFSSVFKKLTDLGLSINSKLSDLDDHYKIYEKLLKEFEDKYSFATNKLGCIENSIKEIQKYYETVLEGNAPKDAIMHMDLSNLKWHWPADYVSYHCKLEGFNAELCYLYNVIISRTGFVETAILHYLEDVLKELAKGVASARLHEALLNEKEKLTGIKTEYAPVVSSKEESVENISRIVWEGTPNEFAVIIDTLIDRGYIQNFQSTQAKVKACLRLFEIKTQKGLPVTEHTLRGYFGKDKKDFLPGEFRIPVTKSNKE